VVRVLRSQQFAGRSAATLAFSLRGSAKAFFTPQTLGSLAVDQLSLTPQDLMRGLPSPPRMTARDLAKTCTDTFILFTTSRRWASLRRPMLTSNRTRAPLRDPESFGENHHGPAPTFGA